MDIEQLGDEKVEQLYRHGLVRDFHDLYKLTEEDLLALPGYQLKSATKTIDAISESKSRPFDRVLFALGIRYVGNTVAQRLASAFRDIDTLREATVEQLSAVQDIGEKIANSVYSFFRNAENMTIVNELRQAGLQMSSAPIELASSALAGKSFVVSGVFETISREELKALITSHGGKVTGSISKKTDYVVAGANMGPAKLEKANSLGVKIISYEELNGMISD